MSIRKISGLSVATLLVAILVGCTGGADTNASDAGAPSDSAAGSITGVGGIDTACMAALKGWSFDGIRGVNDATELTNDEFVAQATELYGDNADPVLSLLTPGSCVTLNSVSNVSLTVWNILIPSLDTKSAEAAALEMGMFHSADGPDVTFYRHMKESTASGAKLAVYFGTATADIPIPNAIVLGLEIRKPLPSAIKPADIAGLNGTWCPDKACSTTWTIKMPELTNTVQIKGVSPWSAQLVLDRSDSGCMLLNMKFDTGDDGVLVYCPAGVATPASQDYAVLADNKNLDRVWLATPGGPGTDAFLRQ